MKKTLKIKIGGVVFNIDEDAYDILKSYLDSLKDHFRSMEEGNEVIDDIEIRIAEIFEQKVGDHKDVITKEDVQDMIDIMGEARDIIDEDTPSHEGRTTYRKSGKRFYRDADNAVLGGVCSGLGAYFNVDPLWFRILFLVLIFAYGAGLVYIILWIVIPKAETATQKLEMRGENVTVQNIEKTIKQEYESVKGNFKKMKDSRAYNSTTSALNEVFHGIGNVILIFLKIILIIIGIALIFVGFTVLMSFLGALFFSNLLFFPDIFDAPGFYLPHVLPIFTDPSNVPFAMVALILVVTIPLIALIYGGIKLIFRFKVKDKVIGLIAFIIWFLSLAGLAALVGFEAVNYDTSSRYSSMTQLNPPASNILYLEMADRSLEFDTEDFIVFEVEDDGVYRNRETGIIYGKPELDIVKSTSGEVELELLKRSRGRTRLIAQEHARELEYTWDQTDSLLVFDPFFSLPLEQRWRDPSIQIELRIPVGMLVYLDDELVDIIQYIQNTSDTWRYNMVGKTWIMTEEGLAEVSDTTN